MRTLRTRKQKPPRSQELPRASSVSRAARYAARTIVTSIPAKERKRSTRKRITKEVNEVKGMHMEIDSPRNDHDQGHANQRESSEMETDLPALSEGPEDASTHDENFDDADTDYSSVGPIVDDDAVLSMDYVEDPLIPSPATEDTNGAIGTLLARMVSESEATYFGCVDSIRERANGGAHVVMPLNTPDILGQFCRGDYPTTAEVIPVAGSSSSMNVPHKLAIVCLVIGTADSSEHYHFAVDLPPTNQNTAQQLFDLLKAQVGTHPALMRVWPSIMARGDQFRVSFATTHPPEHLPPQYEDMREISLVNLLLRGTGQTIVTPATGSGAEQLLLHMGLAFEYYDPEEDHGAVSVLTDADLYVLVLEEISQQTSAAGTVVQCSPSSLIQQSRSKGKARVNNQLNFGPANEALAHSRLFETYPTIPTSIGDIDRSALRYGCSDKPLHAMALLSPIEHILEAEGLNLKRYASQRLSKQTVERQGFTLDVSAVLRWAFPDRMIADETWRQSRSTLHLSVVELNQDWKIHLNTLRQALMVYLEPPIRILALFADIESVVEEFSVILSDPAAVLSTEPAHLNDIQRRAMAYTWQMFRKRRAALASLAQMALLAEEATCSTDDSKTVRLYRSIQDLVNGLF